MVAKRSHFLSISLLAIASAIAIAEYMTFSPNTAVGFHDDAQFRDTQDIEDDDEIVGNTDDAPGAVDATPEDGGATDEKTSDTPNEQKGGNDNAAQRSGAPADNAATTGIRKIIVRNGNSIASILGEIGVSRIDSHLISKELSKVFNLKNLKVGNEITVRGYVPEDNVDGFRVEAIEIPNSYDSKIVVKRARSGYEASKVAIPIKKVTRSISGVISPKDPNGSLRRSGVKSQIAREALRNLAQIVNIRGAKSAVSFEFLYRDFYKEDGSPAKEPELVYASILINGKIVRIYKFSHDGKNEYVDQGGAVISALAATKSMLAPPLCSMKVTSPFGMRRNPTNGRVKLHTGVDLSAVIGTPVRAAADGIVRIASYYAGYGKYVNIQHGGPISTAYGHLSRIVVRSGQRVSRGQIIGYSGESGNSRGAHLHYEVIRCGQYVNPLLLVKQDPQKLTGIKLVKFNQFKKEVNLQIVGLTPAPVKGKSARKV
ncbi:MAG: M23 family metallopeptidase [Holosporales bacterium]|nr:M23 family metallopeptidase [Holosporales bacterium]